MLSVRNLTKIYKLKGKDVKEVRALDGVTLDFPETGLVFLLGKSGSGKSTLLNTIGGLDTFNSGEVIIKGKSSKQFKQRDFDAYRNTFIGFIFQEYNILDEFSVGKNLALALELQGKKADKTTVDALLDQVDLHGYYKRKPNQLSGGQKQRVAIARALIKDPEIIMADEPTGALDSNTGRQVMETLKKLSKTKLVIIVSHDREFAEIYGDRVIELKDGKIISDTTKHEVEAKKSSSGVSFIDNKIIHIKKGQKISKLDILQINKMIVENSQKDDVLISFDKKPNEELKKTAFITDEGNREVFTKTTEKDLNLKSYDPKKFKLIKSKLKIKDAFKMGTSSLKHKPIRLIFTILLSLIAFTMFGVVDTMASFDTATSTYESVQMLGNKSLAFTKQFRSGSYNSLDLGLTDADLDKISNSHPDYTFYKVICSGTGFNVLNAGDSSGNTSAQPLNVSFVGGILPYSSETFNNLKIDLLHGSAPSGANEIVISKPMFDTIKNNYQNITSFEKLIGNNVCVNISGKVYKIVGVMDAKTDLTKYSNGQSSQQNVSSWLIQSEINNIMSFGTTNLCFVSYDTYDAILQNYELSSSGYTYNLNRYYSYRNGDSGSYSVNFSSFKNINKYADSYWGNNWNGNHYFDYDDAFGNHHYNEYFESEENIPEGATNIQHTYEQPDFYEEKISHKKPGINLESLGNYQVVLSESQLQNIIDDEDISSKINAGLKVKLYYGYEGNKFVELEVVASHTDSSDYIFMNSTTRELLCGKYDYALTATRGGSDRGLIESLMSSDSKGFNFKIQFQATSTLDSFSSMIIEMSKVFLYVGIALAAFAGFMLLNFIATSISYKKREIGILRAVGAGKKDVFSIFFSESFVIAMINFVLAVVATIVSCFFINRGLYQDLGFNITLLTFGVRQVLLLLAISVGVAFVSTFFPVWKIAKKNPIDSINNR